MGIMEKKMETTTILGLFNDRASALCCFFGADFSFGEPHAPAKSRLRFGHYLDSRPSNVVSFWLWYVFFVRALFRQLKKGTSLEGRGRD